MITAFLQETFRFFGGGADWLDQKRANPLSVVTLTRAVEHVVNETYGRLRVIPGYAERLREPVEKSFLHIDSLVESVPEAIVCCRSVFVSDPRVNAFFTGPSQLQEVFSHSEDVRQLFNASPEADECWALLCMRKKERRQFGMALEGGELRKDVMQTGVSFTDHQVLSPGASNADARRALKSCIFNSLLAYIRLRAKTAKEGAVELESRRRMLQGRLGHQASDAEAAQLQARIDEVEQELVARELRLDSLEDHLEFIASVLGNPAQYVNRNQHDLRLNRLGVKLEDDSAETGYTVPLSEIRVACHNPRIAALVRFPRTELLPRQDYLQKADLFLAV